MDFGYLLKTLRISAGFSLRELSRAISVSPTYLSLVENGKQGPPTPIRIAQIESALKLPYGYLLSMSHGVDPRVASLLREIPESLDFLRLAHENSMGSEEFAELNGFLKLYGWRKMRDLLEENGLKCAGSHIPEFSGKPRICPYLWPFLDEKLVFDYAGFWEKEPFLEEAAGDLIGALNGVDADAVLKELLKRERAGSTGIGCGIAIPHAYISDLSHIIVALFRIPGGMNFDSIDGQPVRMALLLAGPTSGRNLHLRLLGRMANLLKKEDFCDRILEAADPREIVSIFRSADMKLP